MNFKQLSLAALVSAAVALGLNTFTIVSAGTAKVQSTFGTVNQKHFGEGLHFVNPLSSFDTYDTRNARYEIEGLNIPTQDRFQSQGNVTVLYRIAEAKTPYIKTNYGTAEEYIDKTMRQHLRSIIRDEGRKLEDSRALAQSNNVTQMQENSRIRLTEAMQDTGITIQDVLIQDIKFDARIAKQILATQERIQKEEQKKSEERIAISQAEIQRNQAIGNAHKQREDASAQAFARLETAKANKQAAIAEAEGKAEAMKLIAAANIKLSRSLTPEILEKQRLDNEKILYSNSRGNVPHTVIGKTDLRAIGVPIATK